MEKNIENRAAVRQYLERIKFSAKRMSSLITDVLKYSQLSNTDNLFVEVDLNKIIEIVKQDYDLLIEEKHAEINYTKLPVIKAIPVQMQQLFSNLMNNALKYADKKPVIEISFQSLHKDEVKNYPQLNSNHEFVKIIFKDNGVGFEERNGDKVFELFKRMHDGKTGTGIGLAICKKIVENHNGYITVSSEPFKGTEFSVFLLLKNSFEE